MLDYYQDDEIYYPSSDNEPMGENDAICWLMTASLDMLKRHFQSQKDVYISSNSFLYYVKGDVKQRVAPDLYVVKGVPNHQRPNYKLWEEGVAPQVVFEFTTESSRYKDIGVKKGLYEAIGVQEYYLFDPASEYLKPPFRAFHREGDFLLERPAKSSHFSPELQLTIRAQNQLLRFFPPDCLQPVPTSLELEEIADSQRLLAEQAKGQAEEAIIQAQEATSRAKEATSRAKEATSRAKEASSRANEANSRAEKATSRAEKATSRAEKATSRAEKATSRAKEADSRANEEATRADEERKRAEEASKRAAVEKARADEFQKQAADLQAKLEALKANKEEPLS